jgi:hypothetical protein
MRTIIFFSIVLFTVTNTFSQKKDCSEKEKAITNLEKKINKSSGSQKKELERYLEEINNADYVLFSRTEVVINKYSPWAIVGFFTSKAECEKSKESGKQRIDAIETKIPSDLVNMAGRSSIKQESTKIEYECYYCAAKSSSSIKTESESADGQDWIESSVNDLFTKKPTKKQVLDNLPKSELSGSYSGNTTLENPPRKSTDISVDLNITEEVPKKETKEEKKSEEVIKIDPSTYIENPGD